jgi:hypothetical protein
MMAGEQEVLEMSIELHPETEKAIEARAAAEGLTVDELLSRTFVREPSEERVRRKLAEWQSADGCRLHEDVPLSELRRRWAEEDAFMTDEERKAEDRIWEELTQALSDPSRRLTFGRRVG